MSIILFPHKGERCVASGQGSGSRLPSGQGLWGGYPAGRVYKVICNDTDIYQRIEKEMPLPHSMEEVTTNVQGKCTTYPVAHRGLPSNPGDILACVGHGGCGLGDPIERDPELIVQDLRNKTATLDTCQKQYFVSIDPETLEIDQASTRTLRETRKSASNEPCSE